MKLAITTALAGFDGQPLLDGEKPILARDIAIKCLTYQVNGDDANGEEKFRRGALAARLMSADEVEITTDEAALLKKLCGMAFGTVVVFPFWNFIEGKT